MIVLDTSALIYWTLDPDRLSREAIDAIQSADLVRVSSISIWEIGIKIKRRKLSLPIELHEYVARLRQVDRFEITPVSEDIWLKNLELEWRHRDPADRTIVAFALMLDCTLVTSDRTIRRFYNRAIW